ncbi:MAG: hypothetical protein IT281_05310 [Ignavibacteria bacterium]|nr:nucleotidyltransferase domain-containing protein [Ignavibacteria bacterium]MCC7158936.1 hypothetical protein [Ignavibacteria bacterium]
METSTHIPETELEYHNKWLAIAKEIVLKNTDRSKFAVFLYGSMVIEPMEAYDMDIGFLGDENVPLDSMENIREQLDESIVPFRYDLIDFKDADETFKKFALNEIEIWNKPDYIELK